MHFAHPQVLWLLAVFPPAMVAFFWWAWQRRQELMSRFIQARLLPGLVEGISPVRQKVRLACLVLAVTSAILALARPQWGFTWQEVKQRGVDIVVAVDTSKSMLTEDIAPNRLARAKLAALDLMLQARSDRLGLVAFAGSAFMVCPLTIDDVAFRQSVESLGTNTISEGGTALAAAIETALAAFKEKDNYKLLVLITDGEDHDSGALQAAQNAAQAGLRIFTIGVGTTEGELIPVKDPQGRGDYVRDEKGNVVKSRLNERLLQEIAGATEGGFYLPLRGAKTMDTLYSEGLSKLPKSEHQEKLVKQYHERFYWPLGLAILLLALEMLLPERGRRQGQRMASSARVKGGATQAASVMLLMLVVLPSVALGSTSSAIREYKAGKYEEAYREYKRLLERKGDEPRLHFNAGTAAYRNRQFDEAAKEFNAALDTRDIKLQELAYYNRGNASYFVGEQVQDPAKRVEAWEKAVKDFELSLKLNPQDADAKYNLEFVKKRLEELKQQQQQKSDSKQTPPSEEAKKAKAEADEAVRRREYARALDIMEKQLAKDATTQYYADFIHRLKEVTGVQTGAQP